MGNMRSCPLCFSDLIERRVAVLVPRGGTTMALAAKAATQTIPIDRE
jgi:hypothetical protein